MKTTLIFTNTILLFLFTFSVGAQNQFPTPLIDDKIHYEEIVQVDSLTTESELYLRTKRWIAQNFVSTPLFSPIQFDDKDNGVVLLRVNLEEFTNATFGYTHYINVNCIAKIQVKDGRYKYTFSDFNYKMLSVHAYATSEPERTEGVCEDFVKGSLTGIEKKFNAGNLRSINRLMEKLITSLKSTISQPLKDDF